MCWITSLDFPARKSTYKSLPMEVGKLEHLGELDVLKIGYQMRFPVVQEVTQVRSFWVRRIIFQRVHSWSVFEIASSSSYLNFYIWLSILAKICFWWKIHKGPTMQIYQCMVWKVEFITPDPGPAFFCSIKYWTSMFSSNQELLNDWLA